MVPEFDKHGNLPPGIYSASFDDVVKRFGGKSLRRQELTNNLRDFYNSIKVHAVKIYIDGSYVTSKLSPRDVDLLVVLPRNFDFHSLAAHHLYNFQFHYQKYKLHIFPFVLGNREHKEWLKEKLELFTQDRQGRQKGIICVR
jgi:hypothetical protein